MEKIYSKLNISLSESGNPYLIIYSVYGKKLASDQFEILSYYSTEEAAEDTAKFWREEMDYNSVFTLKKIVFIK